MIRNNDKDHFISIIGSLDKSYKKGTLQGVLNTSNIYLLNIIYNILTNFTDSLTATQIDSLSLLYNNIYYSSPDICKTYNINSLLLNSKQTFTQNSLVHANSLPAYKFIEYWQEDSITNEIADIIPVIALRTKQQDTYENFNNGKIITYNNIGRICFLLNDETSTNYSIIGELNSDVTSLFDIQYISNINSVLIVSKNIYSYGDIYIKIIKN